MEHPGDAQRSLVVMDDVPYIGLRKIISGGQDGSDLGGLMAGYDAGLETGGNCPRFWRTSSGPNLELKEKYGLIETVATNYQKRTSLNVEQSDGTIRIASDFSSPGEILTLRCIEKFKKPYLDIQLPFNPNTYLETVNTIVEWIKNSKITTLNVAGNRDKNMRYGEHFHATYFLLSRVFIKLKET